MNKAQIESVLSKATSLSSSEHIHVHENEFVCCDAKQWNYNNRSNSQNAVIVNDVLWLISAILHFIPLFQSEW